MEFKIVVISLLAEFKLLFDLCAPTYCAIRRTYALITIPNRCWRDPGRPWHPETESKLELRPTGTGRGWRPSTPEGRRLYQSQNRAPVHCRPSLRSDLQQVLRV